MNKDNLAVRFYQYQKERFPFVLLIFTTLSVVLSSAAIVVGPNESFSQFLWPIIIGTITCLFFMFNIRVFDDYKDKSFDTKFHANRPVQRGLISLKELSSINIISMLLQFVVNLFVSITALLWWLLALCYSLIARYEFFCKDFIKKRFILYNLMNLMQMFFLQIYLYALIEPQFSFKDPLIFVHFIFVLSNAVILEIARKLKPKRDESKGLDTYSGRYGVKKSALIYAGSYIVTYGLFLYIMVNVAYSSLIALLSVLFFILIIYSTMYYVRKQTKLSTKILEGVAILFYLAMHLLIMGAALL